MYEYLQQVPRKPFCLICNYSWRRNASRIRTRGRRKQGSEHRPREGDQVTRRPASPRPLDPFPFLTPRISVRRNLGHCRSPGAGSVREAARNGMEWGDMGIENANLHRHRYLLVRCSAAATPARALGLAGLWRGPRRISRRATPIHRYRERGSRAVALPSRGHALLC